MFGRCGRDLSDSRAQRAGLKYCGQAGLVVQSYGGSDWVLWGQRTQVCVVQTTASFGNTQFPLMCGAPIARPVAQITKIALRTNGL